MASPERAILVTGVPRSGTTWLARSLAMAPKTSMPGREPMNPRGRQFALGNRLTGWVRRTSFDPAEAAVLRRCYAGREPRTFSRYGVQQWRAPWPSTRLVVKDPFAVLSLAAVVEVTGARPVLVYRSATAVLASYRRMGWTPDTAELTALGAPRPLSDTDTDAMAAMWTWIHQIALQDLVGIADALVVSHEALNSGGLPALTALATRLDLEPFESGDIKTHSSALTPRHTEDGRPRLHDFARSSAEVRSGWRSHVTPSEAEHLAVVTEAVRRQLEARQLPLPTPMEAP